MRDVGRNAVLGSVTTAGGSLIGFLVRFAMSAVLARHIAPEQFGVYAQASVYAAVIGLLAGFSFPQALLQLPEMPGINATVNRLTALSGLVMVVVALVLWPLLAHVRGDAVAECFVGLVVGQAIAAYGGTYEGELLRHHQWHAAAALRLGATFTTVALVVPLGLVAPGPFVLVLRDGLTPLLLIAAMAYVRWRKGFAASTYHRETAKAVWSLGKALFWNRGLEVILFKVDSALVGEFLGQRALGFYDQARYLAGLPAALVAPISNLVGLRLIASLRDDPTRRARAFALLQWGVARVVFVFTLGSVLAPELAVRVLFGPAWSESAPILEMLAIWCLIVPVSSTHVMLLTATQSWQPIRFGFVTAIVVLVLGLLAFIPLWGGVGAALASTLAVLAELFVRARATAAHLDLQPRDHARVALPLIAAFIVGSTIGYLTTQLVESTWGGQALVLIAGLAAAFMTLVLIEGRHARSELTYLRNLIRRRS